MATIIHPRKGFIIETRRSTDSGIGVLETGGIMIFAMPSRLSRNIFGVNKCVPPSTTSQFQPTPPPGIVEIFSVVGVFILFVFLSLAARRVSLH